MTTLAESATWVAGIYQLETGDPVLGGPEGIDNLQGKQLANRTLYLKQQVELAQTGLGGHAAAVDPHPQYLTGPEGDAKVAAAVAALINSSPATLDTLAEFAAALGNDANFATTITNLLGLKAPLASPIFTGDPKAPTPAQHDNDASLATTEFVQRALGNLRDETVVSLSTTLTVAALGQLIFGINGTFTTTLPLAASCPKGSQIAFQGGTPIGTWVVQRQGSDLVDNNGGGTYIVLGAGDTAVFESNGAGTWRILGGSAALRKCSDFAASLAVNGYQKLPSGKIVQWGWTGAATAGDLTQALPTAFPNAFHHVFVTQAYTVGSGSIGYAAGTPNGSLSSFVWRGSAVGNGYRFWAVGC